MTRWRHVAALGAGLAVAAAAVTPAIAEEIVIRMWSVADRTGPLRSGNIVAAAEVMNKMLAATGSGQRVKVDVFLNNAVGFDKDALDMLQAFAVGRGPDLYVAAHEWVGEFARAGYAMEMERFIADNPWAFADMVPIFWESTRHQGKIHAIPQDSEIRMIFYNKDMLRRIGKDEAFIESIPAKVESGEIDAYAWGELVKEVVAKGGAQLGQLHRPNVGPDFLMMLAAFGVQTQDPATGKLQLQVGPMEKALDWFAWMARTGATPANNTAMSWDDIQNAFKQERAFAYHHGVWTMGWQLGDQKGNTWPADREGYQRKIGWIHQPAGTKGGEPTNLSHPIVYVVNPKGANAQLAAQLVAIATLPHFNTEHAVGSYHTNILHGQAAMPRYTAVWPLAEASKLLHRSTFMPNHADFGKYNGVLYKAIQGVETGRLTPKDAVAFLEEELSSELGKELVIVR
jgi:inositol-phosphate transport system substrate-binding protein